MVKTYLSPEHGNVICPSCGAEIRAPSTPRSRRVQCPKCREIVQLEPAPDTKPAKKTRGNDEPDGSETRESTRGRSEALEARIAALENAVAALLLAVPQAAENGRDKKKLVWAIADDTAPLSAFVPEREVALAHNLGTLPVREIVLRAPAGDIIATERAACLKGIFEKAGWTVRGTEYVTPEAAGTSLTLGVPSLPVGKEAAETYLALKAAGFDPMPVLDIALAQAEADTSLSLTLPTTHSGIAPAEICE